MEWIDSFIECNECLEEWNDAVCLLTNYLPVFTEAELSERGRTVGGFGVEFNCNEFCCRSFDCFCSAFCDIELDIVLFVFIVKF